MQNKIEFSGASAAGFHFYNLYQCCPRKFFLRWLCHLKENYVPTPLVYGAAFHAAKDQFYTVGSLQKAIQHGRSEIEKYETLFEMPEQFEKSMFRLPILLSAWAVKFGYEDLKKYVVEAVEASFSIPLGDGFVMTMRSDAILMEKATKKRYVMETKTSSSSIDLTINALQMGDQSTTYLMGLHENNMEAEGVIGDIAYWHKNATKEDNINCVRTDLIKRSPEDFQMLKAGVKQTFSEIAQKTAAVAAGAEARQMFPRNTYYCMSYFKPCIYADICRLNIAPQDTAPLGFVKESPKPLEGACDDALAEE